LHYIKNQRDAYIYNNDTSNIEYKKILRILNEYQKYMKKNSTNYMIPFFDFENEIKLKEVFQLNAENSNMDEELKTNVYYTSSYNTIGKVLKLERNCNKAEDDKLSVFAVIHNLLIRTQIIPKTDYLSQMNLSEQELNSIYHFQMIILNAIKNGQFLINEKNKIEIISANVEYVKIACEKGLKEIL